MKGIAESGALGTALREGLGSVGRDPGAVRAFLQGALAALDGLRGGAQEQREFPWGKGHGTAATRRVGPDPETAFFERCVRVRFSGPEVRTHTDQFFHAYEVWCHAHGCKDMLTPPRLSDKLREYTRRCLAREGVEDPRAREWLRRFCGRDARPDRQGHGRRRFYRGIELRGHVQRG